MAQGGGSDLPELPGILEGLADWIGQRLAGWAGQPAGVRCRLRIALPSDARL